MSVREQTGLHFLSNQWRRTVRTYLSSPGRRPLSLAVTAARMCDCQAM